jgi:hypothetical protein
VTKRTTNFINYIILSALLMACSGMPDLNRIENSVAVIGLKKKISIESKTWGLAGNHEEIKLISDEACDTIIFYTDQIFYKTKGTDTLIIYVNKSSYNEKPTYMCETIVLEMHNLTYYDDIKEIERSYKTKGLKRITVYDEK